MDDAEIEEIFAGLGPVGIRRMFGGKGIYHQGLMVGLVMRGELLLKTDAQSAERFREAGSVQWTYQGRRAKPIQMSYWTLPIDALDDPDQRGDWVRLAFEAARRAALSDRRKAPTSAKGLNP